MDSLIYSILQTIIGILIIVGSKNQYPSVNYNIFCWGLAYYLGMFLAVIYYKKEKSKYEKEEIRQELLDKEKGGMETVFPPINYITLSLLEVINMSTFIFALIFLGGYLMCSLQALAIWLTLLVETKLFTQIQPSLNQSIGLICITSGLFLAGIFVNQSLCYFHRGRQTQITLIQRCIQIIISSVYFSYKHKLFTKYHVFNSQCAGAVGAISFITWVVIIVVLSQFKIDNELFQNSSNTQDSTSSTISGKISENIVFIVLWFVVIPLSSFSAYYENKLLQRRTALDKISALVAFMLLWWLTYQLDINPTKKSIFGIMEGLFLAIALFGQVFFWNFFKVALFVLSGQINQQGKDQQQEVECEEESEIS